MIESLSSEQREAILKAIYARQKIEAIKLVRDAVPKLGLAEAKDFVEKYSAELEAKSPEKFAPQGKGCSAVLATVIAVVLFTFLISRLAGKI